MNSQAPANTQREALLWLRDHLTWIAIAVLIVALSPVFTDVVPDKKVGDWSKVLLIAANVALAAAAVVADAVRGRAERRAETAREDAATRAATVEATLQPQIDALERRRGTLQAVADHITQAVSAIREIVDADDILTTDPARRAVARQEGVKACLAGLCNALTNDRFPPLTDPIYFKATMFEYQPKDQGAGVLRRAYWHYPPTMEPRTESWDLDHDFNAAAVQAYRNRQELAIPSVYEAFTEGHWMDGRADQHEEYRDSSMLCVPIWRQGAPGPEGGRNVRGIMTIDTNQLGYFAGGENPRALRAQVLGPYLAMLRLVYSLTEPEDALPANGSTAPTSSTTQP